MSEKKFELKPGESFELEYVVSNSRSPENGKRVKRLISYDTVEKALNKWDYDRMYRKERNAMVARERKLISKYKEGAITIAQLQKGLSK